MSAAAGAMALGSIAGGYMSSQGSKAAAAAQERIAAQNLAFQREMYDKNVARLAPWTTYGQNMLGALESQMPSLTSKYDFAKYQAGPEYQNVLAETARQQKALEAQGAASGMYGSGTMANQLQQNAAYLAQQGYQQGLGNYLTQNQNIYNMLNAGATLGQNAAAQQAAAGQNLANQTANIYSNQAAQQGNALANQYNAWGSALSSLGNVAGNYFAQQDAYNQQQATLDKVLAAKYGTTSELPSINYTPGATLGGYTLNYAPSGVFGSGASQFGGYLNTQPGLLGTYSLIK